MSRATASTLTVIRVPRGQPAPDAGQLGAALERDRVRLHLAPEKVARDVTITGPYAITINGQELDEYVAWEH